MEFRVHINTDKLVPKGPPRPSAGDTTDAESATETHHLQGPHGSRFPGGSLGSGRTMQRDREKSCHPSLRDPITLVAFSPVHSVKGGLTASGLIGASWWRGTGCFPALATPGPASTSPPQLNERWLRGRCPSWQRRGRGQGPGAEGAAWVPSAKAHPRRRDGPQEQKTGRHRSCFLGQNPPPRSRPPTPG